MRSGIQLFVAIAAVGCRPWYADAIVISDHLIWLGGPDSPSCEAWNGIELHANGTEPPTTSQPHETCMFGTCGCAGPMWSIEGDVVPRRDDHLIDVSVTRGDRTFEVETEDPRIAPAVLVGSTTVRRGEERRLDFSALTAPSADDSWAFTVWETLDDTDAPDSNYIYSRCPESFPGCSGETTDRAHVRFEGHSMYFTLPDDVPPGAAELHPSRSFIPHTLRCGFGTCEVQLSDTEPIAVTIE